MKSFFKKIGLAAILTLGCQWGIYAQEKPNIIFFLVDDMGWQDTSVPFWDKTTPSNNKFHTPNMKKLAASGVKFTQAYANSICTPSRVSLLSGTNVARHRVTNWTMFKDQSTDAVNDSVLIAPQWNLNGLSPDKETQRAFFATPLPQLLKENGYYTIQCGKAHFGADQTPGANPLNLGFEKNIAGSAAGNPASFLSEHNYGNIDGKLNLRAVSGLKKYWGTGTFLTEALTREALLALDTARMKKKPFFLYMSHFAVHLPFDTDKRFADRYTKMGLTEQEAAYATLVEGMDKSLGDLMDYLDINHLAENTIVVFMSDNGGFSRHPRMGKIDTQNAPLRAGKGSLYEGGIREPMMIRWPGVTIANTTNDQYVVIEDFYPTLLEMAGIRKYKTVQTVDGRSIVPYIKGRRDPKKVLVWNFPNKWTANEDDKRVSWLSAIRQGDWKLIYFQKYGRLELYNIKEDIGEQHDLASKNPKKVRTLAMLLTKKIKERNAQLPSYKLTGRTVPYPDELLK
jgi:arylsulfatase A-like enzyme